MDRNALSEYVLSNSLIKNDFDVFEKDCQNIIFLLENCDIIIPSNNRFFVETNATGLGCDVYFHRINSLSSTVITPDIQNGIDTYTYTGQFDFSHTCPYWNDILDLGIYGLRTRLLSYHEKATLHSKQQRFYSNLLKVYDAALKFLERASKIAYTQNKIEMAENLLHLSTSAPITLYQRLQTVFIFYMLQHSIEGTYLRTLGRLDSLFYPYFIQEQESVALQLMEDFIKEIDTLKAPSNIPFAIGGSDESGNSLINPLSYIILDLYGKLNTINTKFHILYNENTPDDIIKRAFKYIQNGKNSIVFISDTTAIKGLKLLGAEAQDARNYHVVGCYECGAEGELTCSCNARVNIPKALEVVLNNGIDILTGILISPGHLNEIDDFESLFNAFEKTLLFFTENALNATNKWESLYSQIHSSPILSSTYPSALERGGDLYCDYAAKYNNSSINAIGLATAVDSLAAIRQLVFIEKKYTLAELVEILKNDWENNEILRLKIKNNYPKYGTGNADTDQLAQRIIKALSTFVNGRPNSKGGVWRLGTFSIDWRWDFGKHTHATADGRKSGETLSQNTSATFGVDKEGATAHLLSVSSFSHTLTPNGSIADIDLHSSAVRGENGITALFATLKTYFMRGGLAVHYNVLDSEILKKAKENPVDYPNLQVRLCGWNVLFSSLSEKEKEEFIQRSLKED